VSQAPPSAATATDDDNYGCDHDVLSRTVIVHGVAADMEDIVSVYLENPKKNGGPIESLSYSKETQQLTLCFVTQEGLS